jgi:hypothetical protein
MGSKSKKMVSQKVENSQKHACNLLKLQGRNLRKNPFGDFLRDHQRREFTDGAVKKSGTGKFYFTSATSERIFFISL